MCWRAGKNFRVQSNKYSGFLFASQVHYNLNHQPIAPEFVIGNVTKADYHEMIVVWESSVRATHYFLSETDIVFYRDLILDKYFDLVQLVCARSSNGEITGFIGTAGDKIEMLFIDPRYRGKGIGRQLVTLAINECGIKAVDVNEQNEQAVGFYLALGFRLHKRSALDGMGKPYPVLHLQLDSIES